MDKSVAAGGDDWGYQPGKGGMAIEAKLGMFIIMILVGAFGFLVYRRVDMHENQLAQISSEGSAVASDVESHEDNAPGQAMTEPADVAAAFGMENDVTAAVVDSTPAAAFPADTFQEHEHEIADASDHMSHDVDFSNEPDPFADQGFASVDSARSADAADTAFADSAFDDVPPEPARSAFSDVPSVDMQSADVAAAEAPTLAFDDEPLVDAFADDSTLVADEQPLPEIVDAASDDPFAMEPTMAAGTTDSESRSTAFDLPPATPRDELREPVTLENDFEIASVPEGFPVDPQQSADDGWQSVDDANAIVEAPAADLDSPVELSFDRTDGDATDERPLSLFDQREDEIADAEPQPVLEPEPAFDQGATDFDESVVHRSEDSLSFDEEDEMTVAQLDDGRQTDSARLFDASPFEGTASESRASIEVAPADEFAAFGDAAVAAPSLDDSEFDDPPLNITPRPVIDGTPQEPLLDLLPVEDDPALRAPSDSSNAPSIEIREKGRFNVSDYVYENRVIPASAESEPCEICQVLHGDNYWKISKRAYGTSRYFSALALYNSDRIPNPKRLRAGMKVLLPDAEVLERKYPELFRDSRRKPKAPTGFFVQADGTVAYRIGERDTLSEIAQKHLGRSSRWIQIYRLNRGVLANPNRLKPGTVIVLPDDATDVHMVP